MITTGETRYCQQCKKGVAVRLEARVDDCNDNATEIRVEVEMLCAVCSSWIGEAAGWLDLE